MSFSVREARGLVRKAVNRVPEGESIRHLNIMPMMDMMTILLVAFIFQLSTDALDVIAGTVQLPKSEIDSPLPKKSWTMVVTPNGVVVEGKAIVSVANGDVDPAEKEGGSLGMKIPRLTNYLAAIRGEEVKKLQSAGKDPAKEPPPELLIVADRVTPYRLMVELMFSAKQKEAGFKRFRLIVQKNFPPHGK